MIRKENFVPCWTRLPEFVDLTQEATEESSVESLAVLIGRMADCL